MHVAVETAVRTLWPTASAADARMMARRFRDDPGRHFRAYTRGDLTFPQMRARRVAELASWLGVALPAQGWEWFEAAYAPAFTAALTVYADVRPAIATLRGVGLAVGVLTNSSADYTSQKLTAAGLDALFDIVVTRDTLGVGKPDRRVFDHACALLGDPPARVAYVGDEYDVDPLAARAAGLQGIWLRRPGDVADPADLADATARGIPVVASLADLGPLVAGR